METDEEQSNLVVRMPRSLSDMKLPPGWIGVNHKSGGIVYLHKESRVVTWSRPYCIGKEASLRKHDIPLISIPCLYQKLKTVDKSRALLKRKLEDDPCTTPEKQKRKLDGTCSSVVTTPCQLEGENLKHIKGTPDQPLSQPNQLANELNDNTMSSQESSDSLLANNCHMSSPGSCDTLLANNYHNLETITSQFLHNYLSQIFQFDILSDEEARNVLFSGDDNNPLQQISQQQPLLPQQQQLQQGQSPINQKKKLNIEGKTPIQILNEYCQRTLQSSMKFQQIDTGLHADFIVEVIINELKYGIGTGDTLKQAKHKASQSTLDILEPMLLPKDGEDKFQVFAELPVENTTILTSKEFKEGHSQPYDIMIKLLKRHYTVPPFSRSEIIIDVKKLQEKTYQYEMKCRDFVACGVGMKRKICKQMGSQSIIQQLYPTIKSWGSVLRLNEVAVPADISAPSPKKGEPAPSRGEVLIHALKNEMRKMSSPQMKKK